MYKPSRMMVALSVMLLAACGGGGGGGDPDSDSKAAPVIHTQPRSLTVSEGEPASFSADASGSGLGYQWYKNDAPLPGATSSTYDVASTTVAESGNYKLIVSNDAGSATSDTALLQVNPIGIPTIVDEPDSKTAFVAMPTSFSVVASGDDLTYQWYRDGTALSGETASDYTIALTLPESAGAYRVVVSNAVGSVASNDATLTVTSPVAPVVTGQPLSRSVHVGTPVSFSVAATGLLIGYQWYKDGAPIDGATGATYSISNAKTTDGGSYFAIVSNIGGSATSVPATLAVSTDVTVTNGTAAGAIALGDTVHVFANPSTATSAFDHWEGDTSILADPARSHTTFTLGANAVNLTAASRTVGAWKETREQVNGVDFWYYVPPSPIGIIYLWHGLGGSGPQWFFQPAYLEFVRMAVARGYGVAALTSSSADLGWTMQPISAENPDIVNADAANQRLLALALIDPSTPRYSLGMSSGGRFSVRFCAVLGCAAQATVCAQGDPESLMTSTTVPTRFNMALNDTAPNSRNSAALRYSALMRARGVASEYEVLGSSPLPPLRFFPLTGASQVDALTIHSALESAGFLDARGYLLGDPVNDLSGWEAAIPAPHSLIPLRMFEIGQVLAVAYGEHEFYHEHLPRTLAFFEAQR